MNVKNWSFFSNKEKKEKVKLHILDTISLWGAIGLLWFSFISIIGEHFPEYLQVTVEVVDFSTVPIQSSFAPETTFVTYGVEWWIIGLFAFVLWLGYEWPKNYLKKLAVPCRLAGIVIPVAYIVVNFDRIIDGFIRLAWFYLPHFNAYYKTNFYMGLATANENAVFAFTAVSMLLWGLTWFLAYGWKKRILLVVFPVFALVLELVVGLSPVGNGLLYMFFAAMLLVLLGGTSIVKKVVALVCVWISVIFVGEGFEEDIQKLTTNETKQEVLAWQNNLSWDSFNVFKWLQIDLHFNWEQLNNNTPQYTGKTVLEIELDKAPVSTVYLKGFYATNYENGNWTYDDSAFITACRAAGKTSEEVAEEIFQMPYERLREYYGNDSWKSEKEYKISYTGTTGDVAYVPYGSDYASLDQPYTLMGDYLLKKSIWDKTIEGKGRIEWYDLGYWLNVNDSIEKGFGNYDFFYSSYLEPEIDLTDQQARLDFLNRLSQAYLQVPEEEYLAKAAEEIELLMSLDQFKVVVHADNENARRVRYAEAVEMYLGAQMAYSLKLDNLPAGADPIEYALTEGHEGYCMHFASAATLLLREAGIPARYVSGYAVEPTAFIVDEETGAYKAEVGDFMAHAWVEIYLDNIGWVPMEATPGSSLGNLPTEEDMQRWEDVSEIRREDFEQREESEETENPSVNTEEDTQQENTTPESENTENAAQTESEEKEENNQGGGDGARDEDSFMQVLKVLGVLGCIAAIVLLLITGVRYAISRYEAVLTKEIEQNMTRKAVKRINRRLYRMLRLSTIEGFFWKKWTDIEFRHALIERFTDVSEEEWDRYMEIVKKNHYSREKISTEEMQYCYECYKKAKVFNISLTKEWHTEK